MPKFQLFMLMSQLGTTLLKSMIIKICYYSGFKLYSHCILSKLLINNPSAMHSYLDSTLYWDHSEFASKPKREWVWNGKFILVIDPVSPFFFIYFILCSANQTKYNQKRIQKKSFLFILSKNSWIQLLLLF